MKDAYPLEKIMLLRIAFKELRDQELLEMADLTRFCTYPPGHTLCHEGAYEDTIYILGEGSVVVSQRLPDEQGEHVLRVGGRGDLLGEMGLIQNAPRAATVRTLTECTLLEMGKKDFETILARSPRMAMDIIRITLNRMRDNDHMALAELQRVNSMLRQLDRNKLDFIQVAAHELRTPLTVVMGYIELLQTFPEARANATLGDVLHRLMGGAGRIQEVVDMMLDVSRIDAEVVSLGETPLPLRSMVQEVVSGFDETIRSRDLEVGIESQAGSPDVYGDMTLIGKALHHLVINAIKYTPDGGRIRVITRPCLIEAGVPGVEILVEDHGIGIDPEHQELIFEKFYQVGEVALHSTGKTTFKGGGPGLGLALVRGVARAHGGKVWVESPGHDETRFPGSTFHLQLPARPPIPQPGS